MEAGLLLLLFFFFFLALRVGSERGIDKSNILSVVLNSGYTLKSPWELSTDTDAQINCIQVSGGRAGEFVFFHITTDDSKLKVG